MKKLYGYLHNIAGKEIEATLPRLKEVGKYIYFDCVNFINPCNRSKSKLASCSIGMLAGAHYCNHMEFVWLYSGISCWLVHTIFCYAQIEMLPLNKSMDEDLAEAAKEVEVRRIHIVICYYVYSDQRIQWIMNNQDDLGDTIIGRRAFFLTQWKLLAVVKHNSNFSPSIATAVCTILINHIESCCPVRKWGFPCTVGANNVLMKPTWGLFRLLTLLLMLCGQNTGKEKSCKWSSGRPKVSAEVCHWWRRQWDREGP